MTPLDMFNACTRGEWETIGTETQYKIENGILYFQCSDGKEDWFANFNFPAVPYKRMPQKFYVHRGFLSRWKEIRDEIMSLKFDAVCGYSHGAALAVLCAEDYYFRNIKLIQCTVFGCPRVFFNAPAFLSVRLHGVTRYTSKGDIVTKVPPFYSHVGEEVLLDRKAKRIDDSLLVHLTKHSPEVYRQRLV